MAQGQEGPAKPQLMPFLEAHLRGADRPDLAGEGPLLRRSGCPRAAPAPEREEATARETPRSEAGSERRTPPATLTKRSWPLRPRPTRFSKMATSSDTLPGSTPTSAAGQGQRLESIHASRRSGFGCWDGRISPRHILYLWRVLVRFRVFRPPPLRFRFSMIMLPSRFACLAARSNVLRAVQNTGNTSDRLPHLKPSRSPSAWCSSSHASIIESPRISSTTPHL